MPGDLNADGVIDGEDLAHWEANFGPGGFDGSDFLAWQRGFSAAELNAAATDIPEPGTAILLLTTVVVFTTRRVKNV